MLRPPLEAHTRNQINLRLKNLGWNLDEKDPKCNVTQEQAKTDELNVLFHGNKPDYVLYEKQGIYPIGIIEAKRPGEDLNKAMLQAIDLYGKPLGVPLVFAFNDTFVTAKHIKENKPLKIDGAELQDFVDQLTALRFLNDGAEIYSLPKGVNFTREGLLNIFKVTNNILREEGLRFGYERFSMFAEILFLKLIDESERLNEQRGIKRTIEEKYTWSGFTQKYLSKPDELLDFVRDTVWVKMREQYGDIFNNTLLIKNGVTLKQVISQIDPINLQATDTDVKGDAFEYFLKSVTNGNKDLGEYFTPRHIVRTMVNMVKPVIGETVYDPFCGTGGFLLEAFRYLELRADATNSKILKFLKEDTVYGREITSTARITKMNMILFGDGHSNIQQIDSLANPIKEQYNIVLSNIPYSQETKYGGYYDIPSKNADSVCVQHIWKSLKPGGRAAVIVPETFLYEDGVIGKTRELIAKGSEQLTVVSLPRGVFMPYTPTKTNIIYFKKGEAFKKVYFFVVFNDGFELNTRRKPIKGDSDIKKLLSEYDEKSTIKGQANIVERDTIEATNNWNLRPFYYMEDIPDIKGELQQLGTDIIEEVDDIVNPTKDPDKLWGVLEVSQNGVFLSDNILGSEFTQNYKRVRAGDLAYNPYRVNIGSIGVIPSYLDGLLVSPAYVVFRPKTTDYPATYILSVLKSKRYLRVILNYSLGSARASLPFSELTRIKAPKLSKDDINGLTLLQDDLDKHTTEVNKARQGINQFVEKCMSGKNPIEMATASHLVEEQKERKTEDYGITQGEFHSLLNKASKPVKPESDSKKS
ncbi:MAG: N-6 DNA methylase [Chloroflexota bacterium]